MALKYLAFLVCPRSRRTTGTFYKEEPRRTFSYKEADLCSLPYNGRVYGSDFLFHFLKRGALGTMIGVTRLSMEEYTQFLSNLHTFIQKLVISSTHFSLNKW